MLRSWMEVQMALLVGQMAIRGLSASLLSSMVVIASAFWALESPWVDGQAHAFRPLLILPLSRRVHEFVGLMSCVKKSVTE